MQAVRIYGPGDIRVEQLDRPEPGPADMIMRISACGICGSDAMFNQMGSIYGADTPMPLGHEFSGVIDAVGGEVQRFAVGDRVVVDPMYKDALIGCGSLDAGAFADYLLVKDADESQRAFKIPENVSDVDAAFCEPLAVALHAVNICEAAPGETVVVYGAGPIGLGAVISLKTKGVENIVVIDPSDYRLDLAKQMGAKYLLNPARDNTKEFLIQTFGQSAGLGGGIAVNKFIDAAGVPSVFDEMMMLAPGNSIITIVAMHKKPVQLNLDSVVAKGLQIRGAIGYPQEFGDALDILARDDVDVSALITHRYPLNEFPAAFEQSLKADESGKVMIVNES